MMMPYIMGSITSRTLQKRHHPAIALFCRPDIWRNNIVPIKCFHHFIC